MTVLSPCRLYRYVLTRETGLLRASGRVLFIMLNPSVADENFDDPTIRRCIGYAKNWDKATLVVCNLFGWRATRPEELAKVEDPVGPDNDAHLLIQAHQADVVVCAWGVNGTYMDRNNRVLGLLEAMGRAPKCLAITKDGHPSHPLYLKSDLSPIALDKRVTVV